METNTKKITDRAQDFGALIALALLVIVISIVSPEFRTVKTFYPYFASPPLTD